MAALRDLLGNGVLFHLAMAFGQFLIVIVSAWIIQFLLNTIGRRITARTQTDLDDKIIGIISDRIIWLAVVFGAYLATEQLAGFVGTSNSFVLQLLTYGQGIIFVSFVTVLTIILIRITDTSIKHAIELHTTKTASLFNEALLPLINRIVNIVIGVVAIIIILDHFGQNVSSLVVSLGVGSLAVALAAQETIANMIAGFVIMLDRPFRPGDRIMLPSGELGDVYEIGIRSTKILNFDNNLIISPNADLIKSKIINYSYPEEIIRVVVDVGVAYGTQVDRARGVMIEAAHKHPNVLATPAPEVFLMDLADSSVNLRLVARTDDFRKKFSTETALREAIYKAFGTNKIEIPFPQRVVHFPVPPNANTKNNKTRTSVRRKSL